MRPIEVRRLPKSDRVAWLQRDTSWCPRIKRLQSSKSWQPWRPRRHVARPPPLLHLRLQSHRSMPPSSLSQSLNRSLRKCSQRPSPRQYSRRSGLRRYSQRPSLRQADCKSLWRLRHNMLMPVAIPNPIAVLARRAYTGACRARCRSVGTAGETGDDLQRGHLHAHRRDERHHGADDSRQVPAPAGGVGR